MGMILPPIYMIAGRILFLAWLRVSRRKVLAPQSTIPGMLALIVPWLYSPVIWIIFNLLMQLLPSTFLFFTFLLRAAGLTKKYIRLNTTNIQLFEYHSKQTINYTRPVWLALLTKVVNKSNYIQ